MNQRSLQWVNRLLLRLKAGNPDARSHGQSLWTNYLRHCSPAPIVDSVSEETLFWIRSHDFAMEKHWHCVGFVPDLVEQLVPSGLLKILFDTLVPFRCQEGWGSEIRC